MKNTYKFVEHTPQRYTAVEIAHFNLADAIIQQAVEDYRRAKIKGQYQDLPPIEKFFNSDWFGILTTVDAGYLIKRLRDE